MAGPYRSVTASTSQLVAIARAYLAQPDLLVLDEATSVLHPGARELGDADPVGKARSHG